MTEVKPKVEIATESDESARFYYQRAADYILQDVMPASNIKISLDERYGGLIRQSFSPDPEGRGIKFTRLSSGSLVLAAVGGLQSAVEGVPNKRKWGVLVEENASILEVSPEEYKAALAFYVLNASEFDKSTGH